MDSGRLELYGRLRHSADDAATLLLLPGLGFHTFEYEPLAALLHAEGFNCLSLDYRGHGRSGGPRGRWTLDELAADARRAIGFLHERPTGPIVSFGNSLGAMVAILAAAEDDRVAAVVACNCLARAGDFLLTRLRRALFAVLKLIERIAPLRVSVNHFIRYGQLIDDPAWLATIRGDPLIADARRFSVRTYRDLLENWDGPRAVAELHKPLLVVQGRNDRMQPPRQSELVYIAANKPKRYELLDTGHLPHLENPTQLAELLIPWLTGLSPQSSWTRAPVQ